MFQNPTDNERKCKRCGNTYLEEDFPIVASGRYRGRSSKSCAECSVKHAERQRKWYQANREKALESSRRWKEANPHKALTEEQRRSKRRLAQRAAQGNPATRVYTRQGPCTFCGNPNQYAKGFCRSCWSRNNNHGTPAYRRDPNDTPEGLFERSHVKEPSGCWVWTGVMRGDSPSLHKNAVRMSARKFAYEAVNGPQADGTRFTPICKNAHCVNPSHMEVKSPLSEEDILRVIRRTEGMSKREAVKAMRAGGMTLERIGEHFSFTPERARQIADDVYVPFKAAEMRGRASKIAELLMHGKTFTEVAEALSVSEAVARQTTRNYLNFERESDQFMEYVEKLKSRRDELQAKVDDFQPTLQEFRRVKAALAVIEGNSDSPREKTDYRRWSPEAIEEVKSEIDSGMTYQQIADKRGVTYKTIQQLAYTRRIGRLNRA